MKPIVEVPNLIEQMYGWKPALGTIRAWVREGRIKGCKVAGRVFVDTDSLNGLTEEISTEVTDAKVQA